MSPPTNLVCACVVSAMPKNREKIKVVICFMMSFLLVCVQTYIKISTWDGFYPKKSVQRKTLNTFCYWLIWDPSLSYDKFLSTTDVDAMCRMCYTTALQIVDSIIHL